ncbi:hypothetical protein Brms1b_011946 [Colletotrichum noveboracense]|nr:hypothetical protein Brms1b_011946 [Colletotrichum noveboracense]
MNEKKIVRGQLLTNAILKKLSAESEGVPLGPRTSPPVILPDHLPLREKPKWYMPFDPSSETKESDKTKAHRSTKNIPASTKSARTHAIKPSPRQSDRDCSIVVENVLQVAPEAVDRAYASAFHAIDEMVSANLETTYGQRPAFGDALMLAHRRNVIQETLPLFGKTRWMNDTAVTLMLSKLVLRDERFSTIDPIVSKAVAESEVGEVQRLQQKFRQAHGDKETILVPVNIENQHWVLFAWSKDGTVNFYDSLASEGTRTTATREFIRFANRIAPSKPLLQPIVNFRVSSVDVPGHKTRFN